MVVERRDVVVGLAPACRKARCPQSRLLPAFPDSRTEAGADDMDPLDALRRQRLQGRVGVRLQPLARPKRDWKVSCHCPSVKLSSRANRRAVFGKDSGMDRPCQSKFWDAVKAHDQLVRPAVLLPEAIDTGPPPAP